MLTKDKVKHLVDDPQRSLLVDDLEQTTVLDKKFEIARKQVQDGEFLTEDELNKEIKSWFKAPQ